MQAVPQLSNIRQVSDGWIKKYMLAYTCLLYTSRCV